MTVTTSGPADSTSSPRDALNHQRTLTADCGPFDGLSVDGVLELLPSLTTFAPATSRRSSGKRADRSRGTARVLHWLLSFPGDGWQERWLVSGVDSGLDWDWIDLVMAGYGSTEAPRRAMTTEGLPCLLLARVVRPSYEFRGRRTAGWPGCPSRSTRSWHPLRMTRNARGPPGTFDLRVRQLLKTGVRKQALKEPGTVEGKARPAAP
jgi:hypothetical protein